MISILLQFYFNSAFKAILQQKFSQMTRYYNLSDGRILKKWAKSNLTINSSASLIITLIFLSNETSFFSYLSNAFHFFYIFTNMSLMKHPPTNENLNRRIFYENLKYINDEMKAEENGETKSEEEAEKEKM